MIPKRYKTVIKTLIEIAEHGNDYDGLSDEKDQDAFGWVVADIQNWLGEHEDLLDKLGLKYNSYFTK